MDVDVQVHELMVHTTLGKGLSRELHGVDFNEGRSVRVALMHNDQVLGLGHMKS